MPCLIGCLALFFPRIVLVVVWLANDYLETAYAGDRAIWGILGFFFMPLTTLAYAWAWHSGGNSVDGGEVVVLVLAVLIDLGILGGGASHKKVRKYYIVRR